MSSVSVPSRRRLGRVLLFVLTLIAGSLGLVSHSTVPAGADYSSWCSDGWPPGTPVQTDILSWPIRIGLEIYAPVPSSTAAGAAVVCYSTAPTAPPPSPLLPSSLPLPLTAGAVATNVDINPSLSTPSVWSGTSCVNDAGSSLPYCTAQAGVSVTSLGDGTYVVSVPFTVCAAVCVTDSPTVQRTGVVVGTLQPTTGPAGSIGAGYRLSNFAVYVAGIQVFNSPVDLAGAFVNPGVPTPYTPTVGGTPPCVIGGICVPTIGGALGINGATTTVTLVFPVIGAVPVPVTIPATCLVNFSGTC